jgi:2-polyprenyl-3-methyl-5-hydroxy-6-metoxy-1,4-benzoquinol methylase
MYNIAQRSTQAELLDDVANIPAHDIYINMRELNIINTYLGGHNITLKGLKQLLPLHKNTILHIAEIGCGGGDNLNIIAQWCNKNNIKVQLTGIDINANCIAYAQQRYAHLPCTWVVQSYEAYLANNKVDIIFSSLFCHHFTQQQIIPMLQVMQHSSRLGFFINDLHRHQLAYYSIKLITQLFSKSYLVKHDAPLSVLRAFVKKDWQQYIEQAQLSNVHITWQWAFRHLIVYKHGI